LPVADQTDPTKVAYFTADVVSYSDYLPFGQIMPNRHGYTGTKYRFGFQDQEVDDELKGEDNSVNYKFRMHDPRLGRFFAIDPLFKEYPWNSPYAFSENRVLDAVELEGKEAFFIHGTNSNPGRWIENQNTIPILMKLTNNTVANSDFSWSNKKGYKHNGSYNDENDRAVVAKDLALYVIKNRKPDEEITLIGHSHGGNVAIQAAKIIYELTGEKVNIITIATPSYNDASKEDPSSSKDAINDMISLHSDNDLVQVSLANIAGSKTAGRTFNSPIVRNTQIEDKKVKGDKETLAGHSFDISQPEQIAKANITKLRKVPALCFESSEKLVTPTNEEINNLKEVKLK
jgi:RHS repeat-associated protein